MSIESKIDTLTEMVKSHGTKLDCVDDKVKQITTVIGGSGLGDKGLIEQFNEYKDSHHKLKRKVRDGNVTNKTLTGVVGVMVALWEWLKHLKVLFLLLIMACGPATRPDIDAEFEKVKAKIDTIENIGELQAE